ncbi:MAG TPA: zinc ABC transporter substrate-binding protein ZnuA [Pseudomonas xinjiangensis]|uniref:High-affinity zinc uptake system protein ZnuA n=2 Tax=root TaxID=1 RepID=A0A7V1BRR1_9GAMM|nr:zinc ABC transporter substrate-binding protein ZnuA [Halopseudomonas xinjiangensis]HEC46418.1 zinc ABC transporter substrate-binding protein ZnuA [Halopseudomonas xinjiangensis]
MSLRCLFVLLLGLSLSISARAEAPKILATIKPVQLIAAAILDGIDTPAVLLPPGASPHSYAMRPSERRALEQAQRVYWIGPDLEMFLGDILAQRDVAVELMDIDGLTVRPQAQSSSFADDKKDSGAYAHEHDHDHQHAPGTLDAHIWLSPANALTIARFMAQDLATFYPDQQDALQANLQAFETRLGLLDSQIRARTQPLQDKPYFVFHDGYGYLEDHYGLRPRGIFSLSHEVPPGARHVNLLRQQLQNAGPSCVFSEPQFTPRLVDSLTQGLPVTLGELDPLGTDIAVSAQGYEQLLADLAEQLGGCLEKI